MKNSASCIWQNLLKEGDRMKDIVFLQPHKIDSEPFTTSDVIAEWTGNNYRSVQRIIERFQADRGTSLKTFVASSLTLFAKRWIAKFGMHGMSGKIEYPLPKICVFSLDTLRKSGFEIAG